MLFFYNLSTLNAETSVSGWQHIVGSQTVRFGDSRVSGVRGGQLSQVCLGFDSQVCLDRKKKLTELVVDHIILTLKQRSRSKKQ